MKNILITIFILALFLRIYNLSSVPANVHIDEIAFGYNAYALSETGRDEYGVFLPLQLQSFDDYRPALYSYLMIPFVKIFGLSTFSIRLTSVVISLGTVIGIYLLVREFLNSKRREVFPFTLNKNNMFLSFDSIPLYAAFLYAISPWSIFFSRLAIDTSAGQFFFVYGLLFFIRFAQIKKKTFYLYLATLSFLLCLYAYNGIKLFLPPFLLGLIFLYRKELWENKKSLVLSILLAAILLLPMVHFYVTKQNSLIRLTSTSIFTKNKAVIDTNIFRSLLDKQNNNVLGYLFDNRRVAYFSIFTSNYLVNFNPVWLYTSDGTENYKSSNVSLFYLFELPLLLLGIYFLIRFNVLSQRIGFLLIVWLLTAVLPSSFTTESPHATRSYNMLPPLLIIEGFGLYYLLFLIHTIQKKYYRFFVYVVLISIIGFFMLWFMHAYYVTFKREAAYKYQYGIQEAITYAKKHESKHTTIVVSNRFNLGFSYMYYLFFTAYDPKLYIKNGGTQSGSFDGNNRIGKYLFINPNFYSTGKRDTINKEAFTSNDNSTLYILDSTDIPTDPSFWVYMDKIHTIKSLDGNEVIVILQKK